MEIDTKHFKDMLTGEVKTLEEELATVGRINPSNPTDWEAVEGNTEVDRADETEVADGIEQYDNNLAVLEQLEFRLREVKAALEKIDKGTYGLCEVGNEPIEQDRLEANPAAKTCKKHMNA